MMFDEALQTHPEGTLVTLLVHPGARTTQCFLAYDPWRKGFTCEIASPPERGRANRELLRAIAEFLDIPVPSVTLLHGERSHHKTVLIHGLPREDLVARLRRGPVGTGKQD